jgi:DNA-binding transcriptional ArsR family regulator
MVDSRHGDRGAVCQHAATHKETVIRTFLPKEPQRTDLSLTAVLYALSDEVRLGIVRQLAERGPCTCGEFEIDRPKSSLSHHFRVLRESGVVATRREGTALMNTLRREDLDARFSGLLNAVLNSDSPQAQKKRARVKVSA